MRDKKRRHVEESGWLKPEPGETPAILLVDADHIDEIFFPKKRKPRFGLILLAAMSILAFLNWVA